MTVSMVLAVISYTYAYFPPRLPPCRYYCSPGFPPREVMHGCLVQIAASEAVVFSKLSITQSAWGRTHCFQVWRAERARRRKISETLKVRKVNITYRCTVRTWVVCAMDDERFPKLALHSWSHYSKEDQQCRTLIVVGGEITAQHKSSQCQCGFVFSNNCSEKKDISRPQ